MTDRELFLSALDIPDPAARGRFLDERCGPDAERRRRLDRLLAAHAAAGDFLQRPADPGPTAAFRPSPPTDETAHFAPGGEAGAVVAGRYTLLEQIGAGGMGEVWVAKQTEPVTRKVAVKLIKAGMDSRQVLTRFEAERQALALMDHPNIARVFDGGLTDKGRPFFAMELVKGVPITDYCDHRRLTPQARLELFIPVCQAIQHAHLKGVIHRDIKPSNVLVALYDDAAVPKVIDFGVAKATGAALTEHTLNTGFGAVLGTPEYMSPEQATLNNLDIDTRSDVYSLGALLYELLAGSPPFSRKELEKKGIMEILRVVREDEPPRPSTKLSTTDSLPSLSANRGTEPRRLTALLRSELDWVVMKALDKDRTRRYESANAFAADLQRYLGGEPVAAHPPSTGYRLRKFLRKHKGEVAAGAAVAAALAGGLVGTTWQAVRAERAAERAGAEEVRAKDALKVAERHRELAEVTLVRSYLRPVGYSHGGPDQAELFALSELAEVSGAPLQASTVTGDAHGDMVERAEKAEDRLKLLCLTEALGNPETAFRVARRAERFAQAVVGASPERRKGAIAIVSAKQRDAAADPRVRLAACWLAMELGSDDLPAFADAVTYLAGRDIGGWDDFLGVMVRAKLTNEQVAVAVEALFRGLPELIETSAWGVSTAGHLPELVAKLTPSAAQRIVQPYLEALTRSTGKPALVRARDAVTLLYPYVGPGVLALAADRCVTILRQPTNPAALEIAKAVLSDITPRLGPEAAQRVAQTLAGLVAQTTAADQRQVAVGWLQIVDHRLDADGVRAVAEPLVAALSAPQDVHHFGSIAGALRPLGPRADVGTAHRVATTLTAVIARTKDADLAAAAAECLAAFAPRLGPGVARPAADAVVAALKSESATQRRTLATALAAITPRLDPATAAAHRTQAAAALLAAIPKADEGAAVLAPLGDSDELTDAVGGLLELAPHLGPETVGLATETLAALIPKTTAAYRLQVTAQGVETLAPRVEAKTAARVVAALAAKLPAVTDPDQFLAAAAVIVALTRDQNREPACRAADALTAFLPGANSAQFQRSLLARLSALAPLLDAAAGQRTADALVAFVRTVADQEAGRDAAAALAALAPRLDPAVAQRVADALVAAIPVVDDGRAIQTAATGIAALAPRVDPGTTRRAADALVAVLTRPTDTHLAKSASEGLALLAPRLEADIAQRFAEALAAQIARPPDSNHIEGAATGIAALAPRLGFVGRAQLAGAIAETLPKPGDVVQRYWSMRCLAVLDPQRFLKDAPPLAAAGLRRAFEDHAQHNVWHDAAAAYFLAHASDGRSLAELLAHPGCVGPARTALLVRMEELLVRPRATHAFAALAALAPAGGGATAAALDELAWQHGRTFRRVGDAADHLAAHPPARR